MHILNSSTTFVRNISHSNTKPSVYYHKSTYVFMYSLENFLKNTRISNFLKIRQVGAKLSHAYEQTDTGRHEVNSRFPQIANATKNV
jgi:hypothetical protein